MHMDSSNLVIRAMLGQSINGNKCNQPIAYAFHLLNMIKQKYITIKGEALAMAFTFHEFKHYFLGNILIFYVDHMVLTYLVNKPQLLGRITQWLLLWNTTLISYKIGKTHLVGNAFFY